MLSGTEEQERLFVFCYDEFILEMDDYIVAYRGMFARSLEDAERLVRMYIDDMIDEYFDGNAAAINLNYVIDVADENAIERGFFINKSW